MANERLIFVPQMPVKMRYQEWWYSEFPRRLREYFDVVLVLGADEIPVDVTVTGSFSVVDKAINFELRQIKEFLSMEVREDDILLLADVSYSGFFSNVLYHVPIGKRFAICHGTSRNRYDYFSTVRKSKWLVEKGHSVLFDRVFVASQYHREKLGWQNSYVLPFPMAPFEHGIHTKKVRDIISVSRKGAQKHTSKIEKALCRDLGIQICSSEFTSWEEYYKYISESRVMLITSKEETYGYQVFDALLNGCIPIAPNRYSYPEILPRALLYNNYEELRRMLSHGVFFDVDETLFLYKDENNFYDELASIMKKG